MSNILYEEHDTKERLPLHREDLERRSDYRRQNRSTIFTCMRERGTNTHKEKDKDSVNTREREKQGGDWDSRSRSKEVQKFSDSNDVGRT